MSNFIGMPEGEAPDGSRARCEVHPGAAVELEPGLAVCSECASRCVLCCSRRGDDSCSLPDGHAGWHVSGAGARWEPAPAPFGDSWPGDHGARMHGQVEANASGRRAKVDFFIDPDGGWFSSLGESVMPPSDAAYRCSSWRERVRSIAARAAEGAEARWRASGGRRWSRRWVVGMSIWLARDGASVVRMEGSPGPVSTVVLVIRPEDALGRACGKCPACLAPAVPK